MGNLLLDLWSADRKAVLFVTHDLEEAIALSDRVVIMSAGPAALVTPGSDRGIASSGSGVAHTTALRRTRPRSGASRLSAAWRGPPCPHHNRVGGRARAGQRERAVVGDPGPLGRHRAEVRTPHERSLSMQLSQSSSPGGCGSPPACRPVEASSLAAMFAETAK